MLFTLRLFFIKFKNNFQISRDFVINILKTKFWENKKMIIERCLKM
jgi:hypothetical protein